MTRVAVFILVLLIAAGAFQLRADLNGPDGDSYFSVAKSISFDGDLMFANQFSEMHRPITVTSNGHVLEQHQIGLSLLWAPVFFLLKVFGLGKEGFLIAAVNLLDLMFGLIAVALMLRICLRFFDKKTAVWSVAAVLFGTNLLAYVTVLSGSAHAASVMTAAGFLLFFLRTQPPIREDGLGRAFAQPHRSRTDWFILGAIGGLMLLTRGETVFYLGLPFYDLFRLFSRSQNAPHVRAVMNGHSGGIPLSKQRKAACAALGLFAVGLLIAFSPQLFFWKIIFGKFFRSYAEADFFTGTKFSEVLFSPSRGVIFFSPLIFIGFLAGLPLLFKRNKILPFAAAAVFCLLVYGLARAKYGWWQGASFGSRHLLTLAPLLCVALGAFFERIPSRLRALVTVASALWSFFLLMLFVTEHELDGYGSLVGVLNLGFLREVVACTKVYFHNYLWYLLVLKIVVSAVFILSFFALAQRIRKIILQKVALKKIFLVTGLCVVIAADCMLVICSFRDTRVIAALQKEGFYATAIAGEFDKGDVAAAYIEFMDGELKEGRLDSAIVAIKRSMSLYPPYEEMCYDAFYEVCGRYPGSFKQAFLARADAVDCLGLGLRALNDNDRDNAVYFVTAAFKKDPGILESPRVLRSPLMKQWLERSKGKI